MKQDEILKIRIPADDKAQFQKVCADNGLQVSEVLREFIKKWNDKKKG